MERKEYEVPSYELILLGGTNVITESGNVDPGDIETPITPIHPHKSVWSED